MAKAVTPPSHPFDDIHPPGRWQTIPPVRRELPTSGRANAAGVGLAWASLSDLTVKAHPSCLSTLASSTSESSCESADSPAAIGGNSRWIRETRLAGILPATFDPSSGTNSAGSGNRGHHRVGFSRGIHHRVGKPPGFHERSGGVGRQSAPDSVFFNSATDSGHGEQRRIAASRSQDCCYKWLSSVICGYKRTHSFPDRVGYLGIGDDSSIGESHCFRVTGSPLFHPRSYPA